jgi:hypothetical protein
MNESDQRVESLALKQRENVGVWVGGHGVIHRGLGRSPWFADSVVGFLMGFQGCERSVKLLHNFRGKASEAQIPSRGHGWN